MLVNDIKIKRDKIFEQEQYRKFVNQPPYKRGDLVDTVKTILEFNKPIQPYLYHI